MANVPIEELDYRDDGLYYHQGLPFTGTALFIDGDWIQAEAEYRQGLLWGRKREWYSPGLLEREAETAWGGRHGICREWDEQGRQVAEMVYEYGVCVRRLRWDCDGGLTEEFQLQESDPSFRILAVARASHAHEGQEN